MRHLKLAVTSVAVIMSCMAPSIAMAEEGEKYVYLGNGMCGIYSCDPRGNCVITAIFRCPQEINPNG
ncbi:MAG: hypothetical protein K2X76_06460 [Sphingomonas sp.]|nr:hypothetical protein [Sphingomonas sp.]